MTVANPYDCVGIVVHNNSDVLVAFAVAGLIDANVNQPIQTLCTLWFEIAKAPENAAAYCLPVDTHVVCHGAPLQVFGQPGNSKIKSLVKLLPGYAHGTAAVTTPCSGQCIRWVSASISTRIPPKSRPRHPYPGRNRGILQRCS